HFTVIGKSKVSRLANEFDISRVAGPLGQLSEDEIARRGGEVWFLQWIFRTFQIWRGEAFDVRGAPHTKLADQSQRWNIRELVEIMSIHACKFGRKLKTVAASAPVDLQVSFRWWDIFGQRLEYTFL